MVKTIIFDFGNVVGFFDYGRTLKKLAPYSDLTEEEMYQRVYLRKLEDPFEAGQLTVAEFLQHFRQLCGLRCDDDFLLQAIGDIFWPNQETCALVPRLKSQYRLLLGSNTNEIHANHFRRQFADTLGHFDDLVLSYRVGVRKPKAAFFQECLKRAHCSPQECLFIDDIPDNVVAARACGMRAEVYIPHSELAPLLGAHGIKVSGEW